MNDVVGGRRGSRFCRDINRNGKATGGGGRRRVIRNVDRDGEDTGDSSDTSTTAVSDVKAAGDEAKTVSMSSNTRLEQLSISLNSVDECRHAPRTTLTSLVALTAEIPW